MESTPSHLTQSVLDGAQSMMMPTYSPLPIVPVSGQASMVEGADGRSFVDLAGGIAVSVVGHNHPRLVEALVNQAKRIWHTSNVFVTEPAVELAARLVELTFADRVFFSNSGAEANEAAFKLARRRGQAIHHDKYQIVALSGAFHGRSLFTVSVGGNPDYSTGFGPPIEGITHVQPNDIDRLRQAVDERTCAVVLEPIMGEGGVKPLDQEFMAAARQLCDDHDALLIFDEVQSGVGRTGTLYAYEQSGVVPDVLTSAKALGGGIPIGATLATEQAAQVLTRGTHGSTFGGNPLSCSVALAVLDLVADPDLLANVRDRHHQFVDGLTAINRSAGLFDQIRGQGLLLGAELGEAHHGRAKEIQVACLQAGVLVLVAGPNVVRLAPALNIDEATAAQGLERIANAIETISSPSALSGSNR